VARINLDDFHLVNNRHGHQVGDTVLTEVSARLVTTCREADPKARTGGEEFSLVLAGAGLPEAVEVAERVLAAIRSVTFGVAGELTASAGVALYPHHAAEKDGLLERAEQALRVAKSRGKDCAVAWSEGLHRSSPDGVRQEAQLRAIFALARAVDARDPYTGLHSQRLARYARAFAEGLGINDERLAVIRAAALLHDVGKIGVRDAVLLKPARLDDLEFSEMREHPVLGERIVIGAVDRQISRAVRHHHERMDGDGYPDRLKGDAIPLASRILLVADAFDAMTTDRIYRKALPLDQAINELRVHAGTQFDADVVASAIALIESGVVSVLD
jgi:diguanylate cyclase (GGDEF)-like protein